MTQQEFFRKVVKFLESRNLPYMITGSVGAMLYSHPRMTNDMDVVVLLRLQDVSSLYEEFDEQTFYLPDSEVIVTEIKRHGQFNLIHVDSGSKVDFICRKETDFAIEEFSRRQRIPFDSTTESYSATPEDIIIAKLIFYRDGRSEKHLEDIRAILEVSGKTISLDYVRGWCVQLELIQILNKLL